MKSKLFLVVLTFLFSGCSYLTSFYILNSTNEIVTIQYETSTFSNTLPFMNEPQIVKKIEKSFEEADTINFAVYQLDLNRVTCQLSPGQALFIGSRINFTLKNKNEAMEICKNLKQIEIKKGEKTIVQAKQKEVLNYLSQPSSYEVLLEIN